ncbi:hypothetical protein OPU71_09615 [Niveibacterium sp. 24ML]|uniref:hypothetical protein n=1 Tax=Niveibacterium sp. 24ML TaxID=2985512 RepID=UPI00226DD337|nr:hypothetical protein [Niveibacterium sp. 24ML]MCX9156378.1 hypothetical protein [Niveibacterium sp. 24ML]
MSNSLGPARPESPLRQRGMASPLQDAGHDTADLDFAGTNIAGDLLQMMAEVERSLDPVAISIRIPGEAHGQIKGWRIEAPGVGAIRRPEEIVGASVCTATGNTSAITAFDGAARRVQTISGSIYELGMPDPYYAAHNRRVLKALGF